VNLSAAKRRELDLALKLARNLLSQIAAPLTPHRALFPCTMTAINPHLEARTMGLSPADRLEIGELYARYNHAIDLGDPDGWAGTFTGDGTFESPNAQPSGREALHGFAANAAASGRSVRHWTNNLVLDGDAETAAGTCYLILWNTGDKPASILVTGMYRDALTKTEGGWRFTHRKVSLD
jgi:hypothetical protein